MKSNKTCAVPMCKNTTEKCPGKLFIYVPKDCAKRRRQWLQLARRNPNSSKNTNLYFCEDHFDMPNDMENYIQYTTMGVVQQIKMKPDCLPSKFVCQTDRIERTAPPQIRSALNKRQRLDLKQEIISKETQMPATSGMTSNSGEDVIQPTTKRKDVSTNFQDQKRACPKTPRKTVKVNLNVKIKSKAEQTTRQVKDENTSRLKINIMSTSTPPLKTKPEAKLEMFEELKFDSVKLEESSSWSSPSKYLPANSDISPSFQSLPTELTSCHQDTASELSEIKRKIQAKYLCQTTENTLYLIQKKPKYYIGVPKDCYFIIDLIHKHTRLPKEHILLCLKKIKLNTPFCVLGDQFNMSESYVSKIFKKSLPLIANVLRPFIIKCNKKPFKHKYHDINCIIDCLEIEIEIPSKSVEQSLTWSQYKKVNTAKYLISSTPDGLINYISPGYGGRTTDFLLIQSCSFLDGLEPGVSILADRGFTHIEELLLQKQVNLVRPPSDSTHSELSKQDVTTTKQIASLRIHIDMVIKRLREFSILKPRSVDNKQLLEYLDNCVIIACALVNLQKSISTIK